MTYVHGKALYDALAGKEQNRREVMVAGGEGLGLAGVVKSLITALKPSNAYAQNENSAPQKLSINNSIYKTVEEVLAETPFRKIRLEDLEKEISKGVSVLFFYDRTTSSFNSAVMWRRVFSELPDSSGINFIALEYEGPANYGTYAKFNLLRKPAYAYYKNGERLYLHFGGPENAEQLEKDVGISKRNLVRLRDLNK